MELVELITISYVPYSSQFKIFYLHLLQHCNLAKLMHPPNSIVSRRLIWPQHMIHPKYKRGWSAIKYSNSFCNRWVWFRQITICSYITGFNGTEWELKSLQAIKKVGLKGLTEIADCNRFEVNPKELEASKEGTISWSWEVRIWQSTSSLGYPLSRDYHFSSTACLNKTATLNRDLTG